MSRIGRALAAIALAGAGLFAATAPAQAGMASTTCTLELSKYIYNGANIIMWSQGLKGCAGDVQWQVQSYCYATGEWIVWSEETTFYNNQVVTYYGDVELPHYLRIWAKFGDQEKMTTPALNNNGAGDCTPIG